MHDAAELQKLAELQGRRRCAGAAGARSSSSNKERLRRLPRKSTPAQAIDPDSIFDVQVKRLHEYKRQHLNALNILGQYHLAARRTPTPTSCPQTYIFGAKAAPGYYMAKQIIQLICASGARSSTPIPTVRDKLQVVYLEDYRVTLSELLMPASGDLRADLPGRHRGLRHRQHEVHAQRRHHPGHPGRRQRRDRRRRGP